MFSGGIPVEIGKLHRLRELYLYENQLSGTIPGELTNCSSLVRVDFLSNQFSGSIPDAIGRLKNLVILQLRKNELSGPDLAPSLAGLKTLAIFFLSLINFWGKFPHG